MAQFQSTEVDDHRALSQHVHAATGRTLQQFLRDFRVEQGHTLKSAAEQLKRQGALVFSLQHVLRQIKENSDHHGTALLQDFLRRQMDDFNGRLESLLKQCGERDNIADVRRFETTAHDVGWAELADQTRWVYQSKRVHIDTAKAVLVSSLESKRGTYHAPASPLTPKLTSAELQLERQMENLGRCNRPAEAAALQKEVAQNRQAAQQRLDQAQRTAFERKKSQLCGRYNSMITNATAAENNALDLLKCYKARDAVRMASRHSILQERQSSSASYASSHRVRSGWPHRIPHLPQVPGEATEQGPVVPSAAGSSHRASCEQGGAADVCGLQDPGFTHSGQPLLPRLAAKPTPAHAFRPVTAAADFVGAAHPNLAPSRARFCPVREFMPENARPRTYSGLPRGVVLNKTLHSLRACRTTWTCTSPQK
eukprot:jgi/Ulvmu1/2987/UM015_0027.1